MQEQDILTLPSSEIGLTKDQILVYENLVRKGPGPARSISKETGIKRTLVYKVLDELGALGLVKKDETKTKVALFYPEHPTKLKEIFRIREERLMEAKRALNDSVGNLTALFNSFSGKPGVQFYEGEGSFEALHEDILAEGQDMLLMRSIKDRPTEEQSEKLTKQLAAQAKAGIHIRAITPTTSYLARALATDKERLVTRRIIGEEKFSLPSQVTIYGNKVGLNTVGENPFTIIIESKEVVDTFKVIFEYMWLTAEEPEAFMQRQAGKNPNTEAKLTNL